MTEYNYDPSADHICWACGEPYWYGCKLIHTHDVYCIDICDTRQFECGHYGHKECTKSGGVCCDYDRD